MLGGVTRRMLPHLSGVLHLYSETGPKTQTANYCFHYANENVTTIVTLFSNPKGRNTLGNKLQQYVAATCRLTLLLQLVARPVHTE